MEDNVNFDIRRILLFLILLIWGAEAQAFDCMANGKRVTNSSYVYTFSVNPGILNKSSDNISLINLGAFVNCAGNPGGSWNDALSIDSLSLISDELQKRGFTAFIEINNDGIQRTQITPKTVCLWWNANCSSGPNTDTTRAILSTKIGIKRNANSGIWRNATTISAGTEIAKLTTQMRTGGWINAYLTFRLVLSADLVIPATTCNVDNYNKKVILEEANLSDIISHGVGRYTGKTTEFNYLLTCDIATSVSVKLEGMPLSSSSGPINNVLANNVDATKNIGVQVLFNNTPMSVLVSDPAVTVINSAQANETLKFKAYYYYNGDSGTAAGPVKSLATITFDYF